MSNQVSRALNISPHSMWDDNAKVVVEQFIDSKFDVDRQLAQCHMLLYLFTGTFQMSSREESFHRILPNQCIFIAAGEEFALRSATKSSFLAIHFVPSCLVDLSGLTYQDLTYTSRIIESDSDISAVFAMIDREMSERDMHSELALSSLTNYVGIYLMRNFSNVAPFEVADISRPDLCKINQALEYIEENLGDEMQIPEIADNVQLSMFRFLKAFKEVTGKSPHQYIIVRRLEAAKHLLRNPQISFEEIARRTGFGNQSHFTRTFRKHFGTTPTECRRP